MSMLASFFEEYILAEAANSATVLLSYIATTGDLRVGRGHVTRDSKVRVIRDGVVIFDGALASLKHYKDDVKEVGNGQEGGLMVENYNDIKVDDMIEAYIMEEIAK